MQKLPWMLKQFQNGKQEVLVLGDTLPDTGETDTSLNNMYRCAETDTRLNNV